ncbi:MAG: hypothetical protein COY80_00775, partial [Candidatus Pacebacteria bacterium CG_4_10_14_0_8_um_filter_42_14]
MPANKTHITSILQSFSTYLEMRQVSDAVAEDAVLFFVEYLRKKPSLSSWKPEDVVTFAKKAKAGTQDRKQAISLVTQFVTNFPPHQANVLLHQYLLALKHDGCAEATIRNYRSDIKQFMAFHNATELTEIITKPKVLDFLHHEKDKHLKFSSIKRKLVSIIQIAEWAKRENLPVKSTRELNQVASDLEKLLSSHKTPSRVHSRPKNTVKHWSMPLKHEPSPKMQSILQSPFKPHSGSQANQDYRARLQAGMSELAKKVQDKTTGRLLPWLNLTMILLFFLGGSFLAYQQFFTKIDSPLAFPTAPVRPNRVLSFQGRLTDTAQNPVVTTTDFRFRLFDSGPGTGAGTELWDSGTCSVDPDQDGIFATGLGDALAGCGTEIGADVFTENSNVWLQVEVETEVLDPRQQIKSVAYALNAETVQGIPVSATEAATVNTLILMNESGEVVLGEVSPTLRSTSGTFSIEAQGLLLKTSSGSNGDITLSPDGTGGVRVESDLTSTGYFAAPGATLSATYAGGTALTLKAGPSATGDIVQWKTSGGTALGIINSAGNIGVGTTSAPYPLTVNGAINGLVATAGTITTGTWNATAIGPTKGGTGLTSYSTGDLIYASAANTLATRTVGDPNQILTVVGGVPTWQAPGVAGSVAWDTITAPTTSDLALSMGTHTTAFNWATGTLTNDLFSFTTDASANGTGSLVNIQTGTSSTVSPLRVRAGATEALFVKSDGNVGVGSTNPGVKLDVAGTGRFSTSVISPTIDSASTLGIGTTSQTALTVGRVGSNSTLTGAVTTITGNTAVKVSNLTTNGVVYTSGSDGTLNSEALLAIARGGTNSSATPTAGTVAYGTGTAYAFNTVGTSGMALMSGGAGAPTFGTLGLTYGGTNANLSAVATGGIIYKGASALAGTAAGTSGQILKSAGAGEPTWNTAGALTKTDDSNVTVTLGGSPSTALVNAASITLGWTGQLSLARGGTNKAMTASAGSIAYSDADSLELSSVGTSGYLLTSGGSGVPTWTDPSTISAGSVAWDDLTAPTTSNLTLNHSTFTTIFNSTATTGTFLTLNTNSLTTGTNLLLSSTSTALTTGGLLNISATGAPAASWTGDLAKIEYNNADADVDGNALKVGLLGTTALGSGTAVNITTSQTGAGALALRVNDDGTYTDSTPFVVDGAGNVGVGTTGPQAKLDIYNGNLRLSSSTNGYYWTSVDGLGTYFEHTGNSTANDKIRLQSSKSGDLTNYSQFFIDPQNGYIFKTIGTGNGNVGIGTTAPGAKLALADHTTAAGGILFGTDTNIYRSAANTLKTDDNLVVGTLATGATSSVITESSGTLQKRAIDSRVWGTSLVDYSGTNTNYVPYFSDADTLTQSSIYYNGTNVGIGTTSPTAILHLKAGTTTLAPL